MSVVVYAMALVPTFIGKHIDNPKLFERAQELVNSAHQAALKNIGLPQEVYVEYGRVWIRYADIDRSIHVDITPSGNLCLSYITGYKLVQTSESIDEDNGELHLKDKVTELLPFKESIILVKKEFQGTFYNPYHYSCYTWLVGNNNNNKSVFSNDLKRRIFFSKK